MMGSAADDAHKVAFQKWVWLTTAAMHKGLSPQTATPMLDELQRREVTSQDDAHEQVARWVYETFHKPKESVEPRESTWDTMKKLADEDEAAAYGEIDQVRAALKAERESLVKEGNRRRWVWPLAIALLLLMIVHVCVRLAFDAMALSALMGVCG